MFSDWLLRCQNDAELQILRQGLDVQFLLRIDENHSEWRVSKDEVVAQDGVVDASWGFSLVIPVTAWKAFLAPLPAPFHTTFQAMMSKVPGVTVEGDRVQWAQALPVVERILSLARNQVGVSSKAAPAYDPHTIGGHYVKCTAGDEPYVVYYEESGRGRPMVFLHTAGSDSRQFKYLLGNTELQKTWHMYAFDLPYHGRSEPPDGWWKQPYELTTETYAGWVLSFLNAVDLADQRPVLVGTSMGASILLYLAAEYGEMFSAAVALEGGFGSPGRYVPWTNHQQVHANRFIPAWITGLMAPTSPEYLRRLTAWEYSQSAPGVYQGDIYFYSKDWPETAKSVGASKCPLWIMTGNYDYSCTPEMSRIATQRLNATFIEMEDLGHFPMSENPEALWAYLGPVFKEIQALQTIAEHG